MDAGSETVRQRLDEEEVPPEEVADEELGGGEVEDGKIALALVSNYMSQHSLKLFVPWIVTAACMSTVSFEAIHCKQQGFTSHCCASMYLWLITLKHLCGKLSILLMDACKENPPP